MKIVDVISMSAQIFTAIGTVGAVIVSLYLASRERSILAKAFLSFESIYVPNNPERETYREAARLAIVTITNTGAKPFRIEYILLKDRKSKKNIHLIPDYHSQFGAEPNHVFVESDTDRYVFDEHDFVRSINMQVGIENNLPLADTRIKKFKFFAFTNLGQMIEIRTSNEFLENYKRVCSEIASLP